MRFGSRHLLSLTVSTLSLVAGFHRHSVFRQAFKHRSFSAMAAVALNKDDFHVSVRLVALKIPAKSCMDFLNTFHSDLFLRPKMKKIYEAPGEPQSRLLLLSQKYQDLTLSDLPEELKRFNEKYGGSAQEFFLQLSYEHFSADEVLTRLLPNLQEVPCSFEQAGHLAHLNLRDEALPYKTLIAQVLLDKNPAIKTVVNKIGNIETEFRTFPMELLAGEDNYEVTLKESNARFTFNFAQVYWNSRLQMEHSRLIELIQNEAGQRSVASATGNNNKMKKGTKGKANTAATSTANTVPPPALATAAEKAPSLVVADMMAGVGPFAVPLALPVNLSTTLPGREIVVHANDLNPASFKYLEVNARNNHCGRRLQCYNMDAREFVLQLVAKGIAFEEAIMNLPANATDFLDVFIGLYTRIGADRLSSWRQLPRIHVYAFSTHVEDPTGDIINRAAGILRCSPDSVRYGSPVVSAVTAEGADGGAVLYSAAAAEAAQEKHVCSGHIVRDVAPKKVMVCLSFTLPLEVAFATPLEIEPYVPGAADGHSSCSSKGTKRDCHAAGLDNQT